MKPINVGGRQGRGDPPPKTGWPAPALAQDDDRGLFRWFASRPDARLRVREAAARIEEEELPVTMHERPSMLASGWFWLLGVLCVLAWSGAWWAFVEWLHGRA